MPSSARGHMGAQSIKGCGSARDAPHDIAGGWRQLRGKVGKTCQGPRSASYRMAGRYAESSGMQSCPTSGTCEP